MTIRADSPVVPPGLGNEVAGGHLPAPDADLEAKADTSRESIRMALGQLYDYDLLEKLVGKFPTLDLAVLLPGRPSSDVLRLLGARG